jgi:septal ring factor EnvC (AmiA/AmiB activator)
MKKLTLILVALFAVIGTSNAQLFRFGKPKPTPTPVPVAEVVQKPENPTSVQQARQVIKELNAELTSAKVENEKLKTNLEDATRRVNEAELNVNEVQKKADQLREWGVIQQAEAHKFIERYNNAVKRYHRLKIIAAVIASLGGVLLGVQFMALTPPPYNLFIPVIFSGVFAALVWFLL